MWTITDPVIAAARDAAMQADTGEPPPFPGLLEGVLHCGGEGHLLPPAGQLFVQGLIEHRGRTGRFDDVVGQGFVVIALNADPKAVLSSEQVAFLDLIEARPVQVSTAYQPGSEVVADLRGTYARWFRERGLRVVVVRPDYYIFGGASTLRELPVMIDSLRRQLGTKPRDLTKVDATTAG